MNRLYCKYKEVAKTVGNQGLIFLSSGSLKPMTVMDYDIPKSVEQCRQRLRDEFVKNLYVTDVRVIDMLVIKGQMELKETVEIWKQKGHIMAYFKDTAEPKPTDFLSKFFAGHE